MKRLIAITAVLGFAALQPAVAEGLKPYVSAFGAGGLQPDVTVPGTGPGTGGTVQTNFGYGGGAALGVSWNDILRGEAEFSYLSFGAKSVTSITGSVTPATGNMSETFVLGNVWVDIPTKSAFTPYFGGGAGLAWLGGSYTGTSGGVTTTNAFSMGNGAFAFQAGLGVRYALNDSIDLDLGYRFRDIPNATWKAGSQSFSNGNFTSHTAQVGVTFHF